MMTTEKSDFFTIKEAYDSLTSEQMTEIDNLLPKIGGVDTPVMFMSRYGNYYTTLQRDIPPDSVCGSFLIAARDAKIYADSVSAREEAKIAAMKQTSAEDLRFAYEPPSGESSIKDAYARDGELYLRGLSPSEMAFNLKDATATGRNSAFWSRFLFNLTGGVTEYDYCGI